MRGGLTSLAVCLALAALPSGCGGGESSSPPADAAASTTASAPAQTQAQSEEDHVWSRLDTAHGLAPNPWKEPAQSSFRAHPHFRLDHVVVREVKRGHGPAVRPNDIVFVDFVEIDYRRGTKFNRSWGGGRYATAGLILNGRGPMRGLRIGMTGMRPGARRQIITPPQLGGTEEGHADFERVILWDVVLRKILARGCASDAKRCRSIAP